MENDGKDKCRRRRKFADVEVQIGRKRGDDLISIIDCNFWPKIFCPYRIYWFVFEKEVDDDEEAQQRQLGGSRDSLQWRR